jgi:MFS superfamily sulfate permease-like transporter
MGISVINFITKSEICFNFLKYSLDIDNFFIKACLGAIVIASLYNLVLQLSDIKHYWNLDKIDFSIWIITFLGSVLLDIDLGLWIGLIAGLFFNTYRDQKYNKKD